MSGAMKQEIQTKFTSSGGTKVASALTKVAKGALEVGRSFEQGFGAVQKHADTAARSVVSLTDVTMNSVGALKKFKSGARTAANALTKLAVASDAARGVEGALKAVGAGAEGVKKAGKATKKFTEETTGGVVRAGNALTQFGHDAKEVWGAFKTGVGQIQAASVAAHDAIGKFAGSAQKAIGFVGRLALGAGGAAVAIQQMAVAGERAKSMSAAFEALGGTSGDLARLRDATDNMVDDSTLQRIHNLSSVFGVTGKELDKLVQISVGSANALGGDLAQTLDGVMEAYTKKSAERADTYGVLMGDMGEIYKRVAQEAGVEVNKLSKAQKDAAWEAEFFAKSQKLVSVSTADGAKAARQAQTAWENFKSEVSVAASDVFENTARKLKEMDARARSLARSLMGPVAKGDAQDFSDTERAIAREKKVEEALARINDYTAESISGLEVWSRAIADAKTDLFNAQRSYQRLVDEGGAPEHIKEAAEQLEGVKTRLREASAAQREWNAQIEYGGRQYAKLIISGAEAIDERIKAVEKAEKDAERARERAHEKRRQARTQEISEHAQYVETLIGHWSNYNRYLTQMLQGNRLMFGQHFDAISGKMGELSRELEIKAQRSAMGDALAPAWRMTADVEAQNALKRTEGIRAMRDAMMNEAHAAQKQVADADKSSIDALISGGQQAAQAAVDFAGVFAKTEKDRALISMFMETAASIGAFASGNIIGGSLHAAAAIKYGIVAGRSTNSKKENAKKAQKAENRPRGDMNFGWNSMRKNGSGGAVTQTNIQVFPFGSPGPAGRAIADALNGAARGSTGVALDSRIVRKTGRPGK